jgi:uncharacterized glyoxalase superfamily protein PhnB
MTEARRVTDTIVCMRRASYGAVAAGARVVTPMKDDYGWHLGRLVDPFGHHWEIGKPLE